MSDDAAHAVAGALLKEVAEKTAEVLGSQIARPPTSDAAGAARLAHFCEAMVRQCELAEAKAPDDKDVLIHSLVVKAQLYQNWQKIQGNRGTHKRAEECYQRVLDLVSDPNMEADIRYRYALFSRVAVVGGGKVQAIQQFQRVIDLVGIDSELGIECAKEMEKEKAQKGGGCFIATAVYESNLRRRSSCCERFATRSW